MATQTIRKSGNASIISIPKKLLGILNLHIGDRLDINVKDEQIILEAHKENTLEYLLDHSDKDSFSVLQEDKGWLDSSKGMEI